MSARSVVDESSADTRVMQDGCRDQFVTVIHCEHTFPYHKLICLQMCIFVFFLLLCPHRTSQK